MNQALRHGLSKRERQVMEAAYRLGESSAQEILREMPDPPGNSSVRSTLGILVQKGLLSYRRAGRKFLYAPVIPHSRARSSALRQLLRTYFDDSVSAAVTSLLHIHRGSLSEAEYRELADLIDQTRRRER